MANVTAKKIIVDGHVNAVVQLTGVLDTSDATIAPAVVIADFTQNDPRMTALLGFQVRKIEFSVGDALQVQLEWNATTPQHLAELAGQGELCYEFAGGMNPATGAAGFNGALNLRTTGWATGTRLYTVLLYLNKLYTR
jgi:hypothetical protein